MATRGRPTVRVTISPSERTTLEQWARRRTTAQGLAQRAQIVLGVRRGPIEFGDRGELRITRQTAGRWRRRFVEKRLDGLVDEPRPGTPRRLSDAQVEQVITDTLETTPRDATHWSTRTLAKELDAESRHGRPHLARLRPAAASERDVQAVARPALRREGARRRRPLSGAAGSGVGPERRREEPDSGPRPDRADSADDVRLARAPDARLPSPRHDVAVRGARCGDRQGHRRVSSPASQSGVPAVPRDDRRPRAGGPRRASDPRQLRHAQNRRGCAGGSPATRGFTSTSRRRARRGSTSSSAGSRS